MILLKKKKLLKKKIYKLYYSINKNKKKYYKKIKCMKLLEELNDKRKNKHLLNKVQAHLYVSFIV